MSITTDTLWYYKMLLHMYRFLNTLPWVVSWVGAPVLAMDELEAVTRDTHRAAMLPGPGKAPSATGPHLARSCHLCTLSPLYCKCLSFSHPILISFQADSSGSNASVAPWLAFNPVDGHLPLQPYQSGANRLCVPLTHPCSYPSHFAKVGPYRHFQ